MKAGAAACLNLAGQLLTDSALDRNEDHGGDSGVKFSDAMATAGGETKPGEGTILLMSPGIATSAHP